MPSLPLENQPRNAASARPNERKRELRIFGNGSQAGLVVDSLGNRPRYGAREIDGGEIASAQQEATLVARRVNVPANSLASIVYALEGRGRCARKVDVREGAVLKEETVPNARTVQKAAADGTEVVNGFGSRGNRAWWIKACEGSLAQQIPVKHTRCVAIKAHDATGIADPSCAGSSCAGKIDGREA